LELIIDVGKTKMNGVLNEKVVANNGSGNLVKIVHQQGYSLMSRVIRRNAWTEPFQSKPFSKFARNPNFSRRKYVSEDHLLEAIGEGREKEQLDECLKVLSKMTSGLRLETTFNVNVAALNERERKFSTLFAKAIEPSMDTLDELFNSDGCCDMPLKTCLAMFNSKVFTCYWQSLNTTIYNCMLKLCCDLARKNAFITYENMVMVEAFESLLLMSINGNNLNLPSFFFNQNGVRLKRGFVHVPRQIYDAEEGKAVICGLKRRADNSVIQPFPLIVKKHRFEPYFEYLEEVSKAIKVDTGTSTLKQVLRTLIWCIGHEGYEALRSRLKGVKVSAEEQKWLDIFSREEQRNARLSVTLAKALAELKKVKDNQILEAKNVISIDDLANLIWNGSLKDFPYTECIKQLIKSKYEDQDMVLRFLAEMLRMDRNIVFEYWFVNNKADFKSIRLVENPCIPFESIRNAFTDGKSMAEFIEILNFRDPLDANDWYRQTKDIKIIPFQFNKPYPEAYPHFMKGIHSLCRNRPELLSLLNLYGRKNKDDNFMLFWCLKCIVKPTSFNKDRRFNKPQCSNLCFASALFLGYLALKTGDQDIIKHFFDVNQPRWKVSKMYMTDMQIITNGKVGSLRGNRDWRKSLKKIKIMYTGKDENGLKKLLDY
jgi:hypothetical protein